MQQKINFSSEVKWLPARKRCANQVCKCNVNVKLSDQGQVRDDIISLMVKVYIFNAGHCQTSQWRR